MSVGLRTSLVTILFVGCAGLSSCSNPPPTGLGDGSSDISPAWSPTGDSIAFVHLSSGPADPFPNGVYVVRADGGPRRLVRQGAARSVDWSPSGNRLVFDTSAGLFSCTSLGDSLEVIFNGIAYLPSWSPQGDLIAYDDISHVWVVSAQGGTPTQVTAIPGGGRDPDWSPDGRALLILMGFSGAQGEELATVTLSGQLLRRLTNDANPDRSPAWSPSGGGVAWNRWPRGGRPEFWLTDTSAATPRLLTVGEGAINWSPDGSTLVLSKPTNTGSKLFTISGSGSGLKQITF